MFVVGIWDLWFIEYGEFGVIYWIRVGLWDEFFMWSFSGVELELWVWQVLEVILLSRNWVVVCCSGGFWDLNCGGVSLDYSRVVPSGLLYGELMYCGECRVGSHMEFGSLLWMLWRDCWGLSDFGC